MQKRNVLTSPRLSELKKERQRTFLNKILLTFFTLVVVFATLAYLSHLPSLRIKQINILGNKVVETDMMKSAVAYKLAGNYLWLFPKNNILYYPKSAIKKDLATNLKRLKDITLSVKSPQILEISVSERVPLYTWCGNTLPIVTSKDDKCYFIDADGFIFDEAPYFSGEVYFKFYGAAEYGSYFYQKDFTKLAGLKKTIESMGLKPVILNEEDSGDIEVYLSSPTFSPDGPKLLLKNDADFEKVAENLQAAITTDPLKSDLKNKYSSLLYIDLRYGNKVYFKFK